ncbi:MAG: phosphoglycolate phosphatase [Oceanospirillaceae bacterium]|nr:phosphoglycolate phosphatase [Oceanospirillaceae bacterium]MBT10856.1 phosphoglycolate phosphatase [Oceanospirillaceae bacterium]|tara:strand:+ start:117718 stop:118422 length:705 start_codon:yes stop_codon:yes gene_type:complete
MVRWNTAVQTVYGDSGPQLVMLDLDGTLIDSVPDLHTAVNVMLTAMGREVTSERNVSHWVGNGLNMLLRRALADGDETQAQALSDDLLAEAHTYFDPAYEATVHHASGVYPGVNAWLNATAGGVPRALVTNKSRRFTEPLIASLGWHDQFAMLVCGDDLADKKPSAIPLLHVCETLAVAPADALMIGDSRTDMRAAKNAGIRAAAVTYGYNHGEEISASEPDWMVDNLMQLLAD